MIKKILISIMTLCMLVIPTFATDNIDTGFFLNVSCAGNIDLDKNDDFRLKVYKSDKGKGELSEEDITSFKFNAIDVINDDLTFCIEPGTYNVYSLEYLGKNSTIIGDGYSYTQKFDVSDDKDDVYGLDIAIGKTPVEVMCKKYDNVSVVRNNQFMNANEFLNNSFGSTNIDGKVPEMVKPESSTEDKSTENKTDDTEDNTNDTNLEKETNEEKTEEEDKVELEIGKKTIGQRILDLVFAVLTLGVVSFIGYIMVKRYMDKK